MFGFVWNWVAENKMSPKKCLFCEKRLWHIFGTQAPHQKDWKLSFWKCFLIFVPVWTRETTSTKNKLWQQRWTEESVNIVFSDQKWFFFTKITICRGFPLKFSGSGVAPEFFWIILYSCSHLGFTQDLQKIHGYIPDVLKLWSLPDVKYDHDHHHCH